MTAPANLFVPSLVAQGALFVVSHSGGKDSQATLIEVLRQVPASQVLVVHATLGELEWPGALELAQAQAEAAGVPFLVARAYFLDGSPKTLLNKAEHQYARRPEVPSWPSKQQRWCTSELKTGPIEREIRRYAAAHGFKLIVSCTGERAQESVDRAKKPVWSFNAKHSVAGRSWFDWLPIHALTTLDVFQMIERDGQQPHPAYAAGNDRLSCLFCIFASKGDLANAAQAHPTVFAKYTELEERTGYTMHMSRKPLAQLVAEASL